MIMLQEWAEELKGKLRLLINEEYTLEDVLCQLEVVVRERKHGANLIGKQADECVAKSLNNIVNKCYPCD